MARLAIALLAALCCAAVAAAADVKHMTADNLVVSKSVKAKTASSYYDNTEMACMNQMNFKNCRYTGCPVENFFANRACTGDGAASTCTTCPGLDVTTPCKFCAPDSIYFQTDFTCCQKDHEYYGGHHDVGLVGFNDKIGTCDWEISLYRTWWDTITSDGESDAWMPHLTDDGTALKWGTAWGTCYLNAEAEHCDSPLCERMAINIQGGLYATCAYSPDSTSELANMEEFCAAEEPPFPLQPSANGPPRAERAPPTPSEILAALQDAPLTAVLGWIQAQSFYYLANVCGWPQAIPPLPTAGRREFVTNFFKDQLGKKAGSKAKIMNDYQEEKYYPGLALVISGPMSVASKKDHKFEETGMYEFALNFLPGGTDAVSPNNRWPIVRQKGAKVRFTREEEEYYQGGSSK